MRLYRLLTGPDDAAFCARVERMLNKGWELHGSPTIAFNHFKGVMYCSQAIVKETDGDYAGFVSLKELHPED